MKWLREDYDWDGEIRHCWKFAFPFGELCLDFADWIDAETPWIPYWYPPNCSDGIECMDRHGNTIRADSDLRGKAAGEAWLRCAVTGTENALVVGCNDLPDDGC